VSRSTTLLRAALGAAVLGSALLLAGCGGPGAPVVTETPKPEPDFGAIGGDPEPIETGVPVEPTEPATDGFTQLDSQLAQSMEQLIQQENAAASGKPASPTSAPSTAGPRRTN
jgi:hypothetical protein